MLESFVNIFKVDDLRKRILFTLSMLIVYRIGAHIPIPGIDSLALKEFFDQQRGTILAFFDTFTGGSLQRLTIFALGIMPYISASIIMQLLTAVFPTLERLAKEGEAGRRKITQYTRYGTIVLSIIQGFGLAVGIQQMSSPATNMPVVVSDMGTWSFRILTVLTFTAGTAFIMWVGEQINERGIGNGISLIIFAGIVADIPNAIFQSYGLLQKNQLTILVVIAILAIIVVVMGSVIFIETAYRKLPVQYARRMQGRKVFGGQSSHLPLKINASGVIPPIFASSILAFPATITSFVTVQWINTIGQQLYPGRWLYNIIFAILIFFFCFFYTAIQFNPIKISEDMKRHGGFIPGIRPGKKTSEYINLVLSRLTFGGAIYLCIVCIVPTLISRNLGVPFDFGGTALLIVIGVSLDTINQMETFLLQKNYDGFVKRIKRRSKY